jgi:serine protease Do
MMGLESARTRATRLIRGVVMLVCAAAAAGQPLSPSTFVSLSGSVVRVEAGGGDGRLQLGTGVTVAPAVIVTNCHVTRDGAGIRIVGSGRVWNVSGQYADTLHDLCFLRVPDWRGSPVVLGTSEALRLGQPVAALGFTGGAGIGLKFGRVLALHSLDAARVIESDTAFTSGASGGGLFDAGGALVGLLTFRLRGSSRSYYSVPVEWIRERMPSDSQWTELGPMHGAPPFWQGDAETLPYFMRVAPLDAQGRWAALLDLADGWSSAQPQDAEPLLVRAKALQKLDRPRAAVVAFNDALRLTPDDPAAWYGLAFAYASLGDEAALRGAQAKLGSLDEALAADLDVQLSRLRSGK